MKKQTKISALLLFILICSLFSFVPTVTALDNSEKALSILSDVLNLDLSAYNINLTKVTDRSNDDYGSKMTKQLASYTLESDDSVVSAALLFTDDSFTYCNLQIIKGDLLYSNNSPSTNPLDQSKRVLQKYHSFIIQNGASDIYLSQMETILNKVQELKTTSVTDGNMRLNITLYQVPSSNVPMQSFQWFYVENDVEASRKAVTLVYTDGVLTSISDSWNLYSVGSSNTISQDEAEAIAYAAAQNYDIEFIAENGSTYTEKANVSDVTTKITVSMQQRPDDNALFPYWDVQFWFNGRPHGSQVRGIEVGVWGDTKQVESCNTIVVLGSEGSSQSETPEGTVTGSEAFPLVTVAIVSTISLVVVLVAVGIVVKRKHRKQ